MNAWQALNVALVDSDYWGQYRVCLPCMDKFLSGLRGEDEESSE